MISPYFSHIVKSTPAGGTNRIFSEERNDPRMMIITSITVFDIESGVGARVYIGLEQAGVRHILETFITAWALNYAYTTTGFFVVPDGMKAYAELEGCGAGDTLDLTVTGFYYCKGDLP